MNIKINKKNSLIFSVTYENYMNNVLNDKENKSLGQWRVTPEMIDELKYAYAYLTSSDKMIVKKYEIDHFEYESTEKGYEDKGKYCLVFKNSEDVFFEYPYAPVQAPHYRNDEEMDALPRIDTSEIDIRLEASKNAKPNEDTSIKKKALKEQDPVKRLHKVWKEEFSDRVKLPPVEIANKMIASVEEDPEQDLSALLTEYYVKLDKNNSR